MSISKAIQWKWPGSRYHTSGNKVTWWDGPMTRPSDVEIAKAIIDYKTNNIEKIEERELVLNEKIIKSLINSIHLRLQSPNFNLMTDDDWLNLIRSEYDKL